MIRASEKLKMSLGNELIFRIYNIIYVFLFNLFGENVYKLVLDFWTKVRNKFMTFCHPVLSKVFF